MRTNNSPAFAKQFSTAALSTGSPNRFENSGSPLDKIANWKADLEAVGGSLRAIGKDKVQVLFSDAKAAQLASASFKDTLAGVTLLWEVADGKKPTGAPFHGDVGHFLDKLPSAQVGLADGAIVVKTIGGAAKLAHYKDLIRTGIMNTFSPGGQAMESLVVFYSVSDFPRP